MQRKLFGKNNPQWKGGIAEYPHHAEMKRMRLIRLSQDNYTCKDCGGKATKIHHLDNSKDNHKLDNLISLCQRCHSLRHPGARRPRLFDGSDITKICRLYVEKKLTQKEVARRVHCSHTTIRNILKRIGIKTRPPTGRSRKSLKGNKIEGIMNAEVCPD